MIYKVISELDKRVLLPSILLLDNTHVIDPNNDIYCAECGEVIKKDYFITTYGRVTLDNRDMLVIVYLHNKCFDSGLSVGVYCETALCDMFTDCISDWIYFYDDRLKGYYLDWSQVVYKL